MILSRGANESMLLSQYPDARHKVFLLGGCVERIPLEKMEITDPYGGTADEIRSCLSIINDRVRGLIKLFATCGNTGMEPSPLNQFNKN